MQYMLFCSAKYDILCKIHTGSNMDILLLITQCAPMVHPATMTAIMDVESNFNPLAININGLKPAPIAKTQKSAVALSMFFINAGYSVDIGLMQVNSKNLKALDMSVQDVFSPCNNIAAGQGVLLAFYKQALNQYPDRQQALNAALSAYNTGSFTKGLINGYVQKVIQAASYRQQESKKGNEKEESFGNEWADFTPTQFKF
ncbi:lytic transglycosylase domain-containing protein [Thiolapillus sp.]|uniref:lytic transglycosylase domain-containing protein n=2 Tax=Thiolapillus sp. TaxID=2017437 RepID=UPI003AF5DE1E